ncbi:MAG: HAMP domain-containing histidine kinase [Calothrix sp. SM1_5_4]|nr:HAMP domain-containing histidine kinase [Calothrix sp. SM1_5_4]
MRNRFFFIILSTLVISAVGINLVHAYFFRNQRLNLIDRQIAESSRALLESSEFARAVVHPGAVDEAITRALQGARIGKVFVLRDYNSKIVYESFNVGLLNLAIPTSPEWVAVETEEQYVRVRNVTVPGNEAVVLQVGLVLDRNFLNWKIIDRRVVYYVSGIVLSLFLASALLTVVLLSPLRLLISHLRRTSTGLANMKDVQPLPSALIRYMRGFWAQSDEFADLLSAIQKLIDRINLNHKLTRSWTLQMAHELKTPLAIIRAETEESRNSAALPEKYAEDVLSEVDHMSETISQFLDWAELENLQEERNLHALRIRSVVESVVSRLDRISSGRIRTRLENDFQVFANPIHLEQLIANLLTNALKFSPSSEVVDVELSARRLAVRDRGDGLPLKVRERLGVPFNIGPKGDGTESVGNGLGLAWVVTVSRLYGWRFSVHDAKPGTEALVDFPKEEIS